MKTTKTLSIYLSLIFSIIILSASITDIFAQENSNLSAAQEKFLNGMTDKLQEKILLTDEQATEVYNILKEYVLNIKKSNQSAEVKNEFLTNAQGKIENILNKRQKAKYEIIKNNWWAKIEKGEI